MSAFSRWLYRPGFFIFLLVPPFSATAIAAAGKGLAANGNSNGAPACSACHGDQGEGRPDAAYPRLAGLNSGYLLRQLNDFAHKNAKVKPCILSPRRLAWTSVQQCHRSTAHCRPPRCRSRTAFQQLACCCLIRIGSDDGFLDVCDLYLERAAASLNAADTATTIKPAEELIDTRGRGPRRSLKAGRAGHNPRKARQAISRRSG